MKISTFTLESSMVNIISLVVVLTVLAVANLVLCELCSFRGDLKIEPPPKEGFWGDRESAFGVWRANHRTGDLRSRNLSEKNEFLL